MNREQKVFEQVIKDRESRERRMKRRAYLEHLSAISSRRPAPKLAPVIVKKSWFARFWAWLTNK